MDQDNKRYILKKLMQDALGEEERTALNERDAVKTQMSVEQCSGCCVY